MNIIQSRNGGVIKNGANRR